MKVLRNSRRSKEPGLLDPGQCGSLEDYKVRVDNTESTQALLGKSKRAVVVMFL
jgi:hypothetical protein